MKMKLFVWEDVLTDYTDGIVCIYAGSEDKAWDVLKKEDRTAWGLLRGRRRVYTTEDNRKVKDLEEDKKVIRPRCIKEEEAFVVWGGG